MLTLPGYHVLALIDEDARHRVYRGTDLRDDAPVILKTPQGASPEPRSLERVRVEYDLLRELRGEGVPVARALVPLGRTQVLVLEDIVGQRLDAILRDGPLAMPRFFEIALKLVDALARVHRHQVIHRDLRPRNVVVNLSNGRLQIVDFGAASKLARELRQPMPLDQLEGTLAYMSPEQTGRMNRAVDYRADYYALGATFYEMLTGEPPFIAQHTLELVHCHLARTPVSPSERRPQVPPALSAVVLKLLAKLAEERYQSIAGLRADLEHCARAWASAERIEPFTLGRADTSNRFVLPQRLYGREAESRMLLGAFARVASSGRPELMLVAGYSGAGKSTLVAELHKPIVARRGHFIDGKVDQFRREVPYAALVAALRGLIQQVLAEPAVRLETWRKRIAEALGDNAQIIVDLVPQLHLIVGAQPRPPELPAEQAQHRVHRSVRQFISVFTQPEHPLVLFLDDLQWIDAGTAALLVHLLSAPQTRHLLVLGAYRDNEVGPEHALPAMRAELERRSVANGCITLAPLQREHVAQLVADALHCDAPRAEQLAELVFAKTRGNPFFAFQFLTALHGDGYITFDEAEQRWRWDMSAIASRNFTDNVVELMLAELQRLPQATRDALALAGLLGNRYTRGALAIVGEHSLASTEAALHPALELGLVARGADSYRFLHDRVQEAALALIPESERALRHWHIGCRLHDGLDVQALDDACFEVAEHLNQGAATEAACADPAHRLSAARLNLRAGEKALASTAYPAAVRHFAAGAAFLDETDWASQHELMFALQLGRAKSAWLTGDFDTAGRLVEDLQARARDDIEWASAAQIGVELKVTQHDTITACEAAIVCLRRLGMDLAAHPTREDAQQTYARFLALLGDRPIDSLAELPRMTDLRRIAAMRIIASVHAVVFFTNRELWAVQTCEMVMTMMRYGRNDASPTCFAVFGFVVGSYFGDHQSAFRYGELAFDLMVRDGTPHYFASVQYHRALIGSWVRPLREVLVLERQALQGFIDVGDRLIACVCAHRVAMDALMQAEPLVALAPRVDEYLAMATQARYAHGVETLTIRRQQVRSLRGETRFLGSLDDPSFDEEAFIAQSTAARAPAVNCWFHLARLATACIAGDDARGHEAALAAEPWFAHVDGLLSAHDYYFYDALCVAGMIDDAEPVQRAAWRGRLKGHESYLQRWSGVNAQTFGHSQLLVAAELARVDGEPTRAMGLYEQAIAAARAHGFVQIEALANERAARSYRRHGAASVADGFVRAARLAYARWGAEAKLRLLDKQYPHLARSRSEVDATSDSRVNPAAQIDALAIVRAAQAITGQLRPEQLLRELLAIVLQQAGAQFGALLLVRGDALELAATARGDGPQIVVDLVESARPPGGTAPVVPSSIATYVWRSGERVLIDDAHAPNRYADDATLAANQARSVLAVPIVRQARVTGVLYLEHRAAAHVFTLESAAVIEQLAAQAAISLETAQLYAELGEHKLTLEAKVEARTQELERSRAVLQTMLDGLPAMISMKDRAGRYVLHNRQYAEAMGRPGGSFVGLRIDDLASAATAERVHAQDAQVLASEAGLRFEEEMQIVGGPRTFQIHKFPIRDDLGQVDGIGAIAIDVTDLKASRSAAEAAAEAKSQFLANMSHEIRTPMNAILGMAHLALRSGLNAQQHNYVQKVEHSARSLLGLLNDILDFSKIEAGKLDLESRPFDLRDVLDNLDSVIGLQAAEKGLELIVDCGADVPTALVGDALRLGQILVNLGNNAVKFTDQGEVTVRIEASERTADDVLLRFWMIDTGVGMSAEERQRLFTAFTQADASTSRRYGGTGLGLAISRELVQLLGGSIQVESERGQGSSFSFEIRVRMQPQQAAARADGPLHGSRVLVVDDNAAAARVIVAMCRELGWDTEAVATGWDALRAVTLAAQAGDPYHLVLADASMPGMDGVECAQRLAESDHGRRAVVLMCAPYARDALMKRVATLRVVPAGVLAKPVMIESLFDVCAAALGTRRPDDARVQRPEPVDSRERLQLRGARILLVEDNPINQELALELLRDAGVSVAVAAHGREAIEILERERFDGVLMDCQMPVMDGYEATREIRRRPEWVNLPIIAMTANAMASDQRKVLAAGMNDHIAKPIDVATMYQTIARWVRGPQPAGATASGVPLLDTIETRDLAALLPGIDTRIGLASTAGNEKLYRRLLVKFREGQADFVATFRAARERGDPVGATRLAHDLRAVSGTLGAKQLERQAQLLEAECRSGGEGSVVAMLLEQVANELTPVMNGLRALG